MKIFPRDLNAGDIVRFHLTDGSSAEGEYVSRSRRYYTVRAAKIEAGASLVAVTGDRLLVRRSLVKLAQVVDA